MHQHHEHDHHDHRAPDHDHDTRVRGRRRRRARLATGDQQHGDDRPGRGPSSSEGRGRGRGRSPHGGGHRGGPHGPGGRTGFGGGRRRDRGEVRIAVLLLLAEAPMHGYGIMREVAVRSNGTWRLSPGAVYPTLNALEADGLVTATGDSGRSVYELSERGRRAAAELDGTPPPWETHDDDQLAELGQAVEALVVAARQIAEVGEARQQADAVAVLVQARRRLYALLAREPDTELGGDDQP